MKTEPGTYALILECAVRAELRIGRRLRMETEPGYYVYVGSAFGPGGVRARVFRHFKKEKAKRWHIDFLRESVTFREVWYSHAPEHLEHVWARIFHDMAGVLPVERFGCTDCKCRSHLFRTPEHPDLDVFSRRAGGKIEVCGATGEGFTEPEGISPLVPVNRIGHS
jgi:Uri superfamily endonuclease